MIFIPIVEASAKKVRDYCTRRSDSEWSVDPCPILTLIETKINLFYLIGLFQRVIMLSGNGLANWSFSYDPVTKGIDRTILIVVIFIGSILWEQNFQFPGKCSKQKISDGYFVNF